MELVRNKKSGRNKILNLFEENKKTCSQAGSFGISNMFN